MAWAQAQSAGPLLTSIGWGAQEIVKLSVAARGAAAQLHGLPRLICEVSMPFSLRLAHAGLPRLDSRVGQVAK